MISGTVDDGFGPLADAFAENFARGSELGAAVAVYVRGRKVVDLWGGVADQRTHRPWTEHSSAVIFSCTKGLMAMCAYKLAENGQLDLDAPVVEYWPEFGKHGKASILVRWLLSHRAGLPVIDRPLTRQAALAWTPVIAAIEQQRPAWKPGTAHTYHAKTYGWLIGEVIRRVTGLTPGTYFREAIADPLGLRTRVGLPIAEQGDVARTEAPPVNAAQADQGAPPTRSEIEERAVTLNGTFPFPDLDGEVVYNDPEVRAAELPAGNGISTARDLALAYAACAGPVRGPRIMSGESVEDALREQSSGPQRFGPAIAAYRWGTGFMLDSPPVRPMLGPRSFGHDGAGGQLGFGDDEYQLGFAYVNNQMGGWVDDRANRLTAALRACLGTRTDMV
jgi:CubicO group peptidase (beta-lactamase class C family)